VCEGILNFVPLRFNSVEGKTSKPCRRPASLRRSVTAFGLRPADLMNVQNADHQADESSQKYNAHTNVNERVYFLPPFGWFRLREQVFFDLPINGHSPNLFCLLIVADMNSLDVSRRCACQILQIIGHKLSFAPNPDFHDGL
jgi:hypothetical protein